MASYGAAKNVKIRAKKVARAGLKGLEWYITFQVNNGAKLSRESTVSLKKRGSWPLPRYPSLISVLELAVGFVSKAHVTKMKLNLNFFPLGLQIPQTSYCIF